ncbi:MAG: hypothetical protein RL380_1032 [Verrucomicrobiota bacterium]
MQISRKELLLLALVLGLLGVYAVWFTDWFRPVPLHVEFSARPYVTPRTSRDADGTIEKVSWSVTFALGQSRELTAVRVVEAAKFAADPQTPAIWRLAGHSRPVRGFTYGADLEGMKAFVPGMTAHPLATDVKYLLLVEAGRARGEREFTLTR